MTATTLDPTCAPKGARAELCRDTDNLCTGCDFLNPKGACLVTRNPGAPCDRALRADGCDVIFVKENPDD